MANRPYSYIAWTYGGNVMGLQGCHHTGCGKGICDGRTSPGLASWSQTYEVGTNPRQTSNALGIPESIRVVICNDSVLIMHVEGGRSGTKGNAVHLWSTMHLDYYVSQKAIVGGATAHMVSERLPTEPYDIANEDVTLVFCMLNEASGDRTTGFSETPMVGRDAIGLCRNMLRLTRPMLVIGGASDIWRYSNPAWVTLVIKMVIIARGIGIPTITGEHYLRRLTLKKTTSTQ